MNRHILPYVLYARSVRQLVYFQLFHAFLAFQHLQLLRRLPPGDPLHPDLRELCLLSGPREHLVFGPVFPAVIQGGKVRDLLFRRNEKTRNLIDARVERYGLFLFPETDLHPGRFHIRADFKMKARVFLPCAEGFNPSIHAQKHTAGIVQAVRTGAHRGE